ncbi:MAG: hypothetical protein WAR57_12525 [Candidatus Phosphoribacter sp.]|nr:hypothetical protein [Actinomycetales bacterium]
MSGQHDSIARFAAVIDSLQVGRDRSLAPAPAPLADFVSDRPQGAIAQASLASYSPEVSSSTRAAVANWLLMAQAVANVQVPDREQSGPWMDAFVDTLTSTGWFLAEHDSTFSEENVAASTVHEAIIEVVGAVLAPVAPAAAALVVLMLKQLRTLDEDSPWITVFDRRSHRARTAGFSVNNVDVSEPGLVSMRGVDFVVHATDVVTQVLFFKFKGSSATLNRRFRVLQISEATVAQLAPSVEAKVRTLISHNITALPELLLD